jgi:mRNA-degrading endonuclease HigB of HigAB toxin-antitoxin module
LLKNRYESALATLAKQEKLFIKNKIDYSEYLYARNQLNEAAQNYYEFLKKHDQKVSLNQNVKIKRVFVRANQDIYYGMPLFEMIPGNSYRLTTKLPFEYLKKLGINKKIVLKDEQGQTFWATVESLDIRGRDFFVVIKITHNQLKENQKLKLTIQ